MSQAGPVEVLEAARAAGDHETARASSTRCAARRRRGLLSDEHFSVDGTLIEAWASRRASSQGRPGRGWGGKAEVDFRGERRRNGTHASPPMPMPACARRPQGEADGVRARTDGEPSWAAVDTQLTLSSGPQGARRLRRWSAESPATTDS